MENAALITGTPQGPPYERLPVTLNLVSRFGIGYSVRSDSYGYNDLATAAGMRTLYISLGAGNTEEHVMENLVSGRVDFLFILKEHLTHTVLFDRFHSYST